jgi:N-carbamoyl-L-amino-acid hydrolase
MAMDKSDIVKEIRSIFNRFEHIGCLENGGVTRLGYSSTEDEMHRTFLQIGKEYGFDTFTDNIGNSYVSNCKRTPATWICSHLDSVVSGGRYDGVIGVIVGLAVLLDLSAKGIRIPVRAGAFRCEESTNFNKCTIGSGLLSKEYTKATVANLTDKEGKKLSRIFEEKGLLYADSLEGIKEYLEVHIEQGKILEDSNKIIGIVHAIVGNERLEITIQGQSEHSGTTPMGIRKDSLCFASELVSFAESYAKAHDDIVITAGELDNFPNVINVIPGKTKLTLDIRSQDQHTLTEAKRAIRHKVEETMAQRSMKASIKEIGKAKPVHLSQGISTNLAHIVADQSIPYADMVSGAGHDAMCFADIVPTGMLFIPCKNGISHNEKEYAKLEDAGKAADILVRYLEEKYAHH